VYPVIVPALRRSVSDDPDTESFTMDISSTTGDMSSFWQAPKIIRNIAIIINFFMIMRFKLFIFLFIVSPMVIVSRICSW
jgi:hypothetical protein